MYRKVLVPLDGSPLAECALPHVKSLVKDGSIGEVTLLTILAFNIPYVAMRPEFEFPGTRNQRIDEFQNYLTRVQSQLSREGINVETMVIEAALPAHAIVEYAQQSSVDLIVIASHGYTGMKKLVFGSVALSVLHDSPVPVLLIKPEAC